MNEPTVYIALIAYVSFIITSLTGTLGGMMLLAAMALYFPVGVMIPLHAVIHLSGDIGRILPSFRTILIRPALVFSLWTLPGIAIGYFFVLTIDSRLITVTIALYILFITWVNKGVLAKLANLPFAGLGLLMGYLSISIGAPGPLHLARIQRAIGDAGVVITTAAFFTAFINVVKVSLFLQAGFEFSSYGWALGIGSASAIAGSMTGVWIRNRYPGALNGKSLVKAALSLAALLMIIKALWEL